MALFYFKNITLCQEQDASYSYIPPQRGYLCYYLRPRWSQGQGINNNECRWGLTGFYPSMVFVPLVYNSGDQNVLINDWYACFQVLSKQLTVWHA